MSIRLPPPSPSRLRLLVFITLVFQVAVHGAAAATTVGFYSSSCPNAEAIVKGKMQEHFNADPSIGAGILRMFFHDCFVRGCDASVLLDSTPKNKAEKDNGANRSLRGFNVINDIKAALEAACPRTVSCADLLAFAARDYVSLTGGPSYAVGGGRLDSLRSVITDADILPSPFSAVDEARQAFESQGFSIDEMVALLGAHTVGFGSCGFVAPRLYNFENTGQADPSMSQVLISRLSATCPKNSRASTPPIALDQGTSTVFDSSFYTQLTQGNGVLQLDQELDGDGRTAPLVSQFTNQDSFFSAFVGSITKLGELNIKQSPSQGEVRLHCNMVNPPSLPPLTPPPVPSPPPPPPSPQVPVPAAPQPTPSPPDAQSPPPPASSSPPSAPQPPMLPEPSVPYPHRTWEPQPEPEPWPSTFQQDSDEETPSTSSRPSSFDTHFHDRQGYRLRHTRRHREPFQIIEVEENPRYVRRSTEKRYVQRWQGGRSREIVRRPVYKYRWRPEREPYQSRSHKAVRIYRWKPSRPSSKRSCRKSTGIAYPGKRGRTHFFYKQRAVGI
ncbi:hypothetical protein KP509_18G014600 [Ceratopteris richardii]|uniref:peroxidase n=1 Tax=Ceratopteris richardii TaxID=49495 RepID=A0A8T2SPW3_CERRI|nr:hypothetical protein KP509_18G014500 [Ceratopteris richardii]KAH7365217.1 hypothetical protein KP509_18G014600 [Ceratopteris richardii]